MEESAISIPVCEGCFIEQLQQRHGEELFAIVDKHRDYLRRWLGWVDYARTLSDQYRTIELWQQKLASSGALNGAIVLHGNLVGVVGFNSIDRIHSAASIGYWLSPEHTGQGLMTKSCRSLIQYGFRFLKLKRQEIRCATQNIESNKVPQRLGMSYEGCLRSAENLYGIWVDLNVYSAIREEWQNTSSHHLFS